MEVQPPKRMQRLSSDKGSRILPLQRADSRRRQYTITIQRATEGGKSWRNEESPGGKATGKRRNKKKEVDQLLPLGYPAT